MDESDKRVTLAKKVCSENITRLLVDNCLLCLDVDNSLTSPLLAAAASETRSGDITHSSE